MLFTEKTQKILEFDKIRERLCDSCVTDGAKARALSLSPSDDYETVVTRQTKTEDAKRLVNAKGFPSFSASESVVSSADRAYKGAVLSPKELIEVASLLRCARGLLDYISTDKPFETSLDEIFRRMLPSRELEDKITRSIISEELISDEASPELADIRRKIRVTNNKIKDTLQSFIGGNRLKYLQENIVTMRNGRYVVPVKAEHRNELKGLVHDTSSSGATLFVEPMAVVEANNELKTLAAAEEHEIERILSALSAECAAISSQISLNYHNITELSFVFGCASLAMEMKAESPQIIKERVVDLKRARHPLIPKDKVVPIDVSVGEANDTLIITGPNTGGKTVTLKTVGLLTVMAQSGLQIPALESSRVGIFDSILADIGDEQSIEQSLSTFSAHMVNIVDILAKVNESSLVLFDELGAGTDPIEGAALAEAILERIRSIECLCAATTHYAELKAYALETDGVSNASCEFNLETLRPTYKLTIGLPGRSNAFAIAQRLGIDETIISAANDYVPGASRRFEEVVNELENARSGLEAEREQARKLKEELKEAKEKARRDREELNLRIADLEAKAETEARKLIDSAKAASDYIFEELDEIKRKKEAEDFAKAIAASKANVAAKVKQASDKLGINLERAETIYKPSREFKAGDEILVYDLKQEGKIIKIDKDQYHVQVGYAKLKTTKENLRLLCDIESETPKKKKPSTMRKVNRNGMSTPQVSRDIRSEIDVRGMIGDDAWMEVDKYIDCALLANLGSVTVVHGKGTGALRAAITGRLKKDKRVASFRQGDYGEGDSGVTVITLK